MQEQEEKTTTKEKKSWPHRVARIFLKTILFLFLFIIIVFLLILTPPVQRFLTSRVENYLEKKLETKVEIGRIGFGLSGNVRLLDIYIEDKTKDTLVSGEAIKANVNFVKLFSNEVEVKDIELQNVTAKIKRVLPDTTFNYQFIVDAFTSEQPKEPDTAQTAPMKLNISDITLDNVALTYKDAVTGVDMYGRIGYATTTIDNMDPYTQTFDFPSLIVRNTVVKMKQVKPLLEPKTMAEDIAEAQAPQPMNFSIGVIDLTKVSVQYDNDVSALYSRIAIGKAKAEGRLLDLEKNKVYLNELSLANTKAVVRLGKSPGAQQAKQQAEQEVAAESTAGWDFRVNRIRFDNNDIRFDDDNQPRQSHGMDYAHLNIDDLTLHANDFVFKPDSTALTIVQGSMKEQSGFALTQLQGDILYGANQTYLKNLLIKTPGSEIKRSAVLQYASLEELQNHFERAVIDLDVVNSYLQVKDILVFAPQLRSQPGFRNPADIWHFNLVAQGTMDRLVVDKLQFDGLQNTQVNAAGTLLGLANPQHAGGNFTIYRFHTTKSDMALFTPPDLSQQVDLPQSLTMSGLISGNTGRLNARLDVMTTDGNLDFNGRFANLMNPATLSYDATLRASGLRLGKILRQQGQIGNLTGTVTVNGRGATPGNINTQFKVDINNVGYNNYAYRNIQMNGTLRNTVFTINANVIDPNIDIRLTAGGDYAAYGPFRIDADIDSVKLHNLGFSQDKLIFRGELRGTADDINTGSPSANIMLTDALLVSGANRLPIDSLKVLAGRDTANYLVLQSNIASAELRGQYNLLQLGDIIQNNLAPYFSAATVKKTPVEPYDIRFRADFYLSPALQGFVPDLKEADSVHMQGTLATNEGLDAVFAASNLVYQTNVIRNLEAKVNTNDSGLHVNATMARLQAAGLDLYATRINATAMQNNINFTVGVDDKEEQNRYYLSGMVEQRPDGNMTVHLRPDSLLLNYDRWQINPGNSITIGEGVRANDFVLAHDGQQLSLQSQGPGLDAPLQVRFTDFRLGTLTSFVKPDTTLVDGVMNGTATFTNLTQQPLFTSDLEVSNLSLMRDTVGNLNAKVSSTGERYNTDITLTGRGNDLAITGYAEPSGDDIAMNLDLAVRSLQLNTFKGATRDFLTDASGNIYGKVSLQGTTSKPDINGKLNFDKASITTVAIGGPFTIDDESLIAVDNEGLMINQFSIRDSANNAITFDGKVATTNYSNFDFDINIRAQDFMAVNNTKKQNNLFYGKLNLSTNMHIGGDETEPVIDGSLSVNEGTNFTVVLPQEAPGVVAREGVVEFVDFNDSTTRNDSLFLAPYDSLNQSSLVGFDVATNLIVDKDAIFNIVIDEANGDLVNLQGEANLSAGIDPSGKINLTGTYEIEQGAYQLSYNFIQRRFEIEKGSRIEWYGDPTLARVDMTAIYIANTAPLDLVSDYIAASAQSIRNTYLQKLPFQVVLSMEGELLQPELSFDIRLPTDRNYNVSSDIISNVDTRLTQLRQEPSELNKQVFSLLLLGRFVSDNPFQSSGDGFSAGAYARQSVSKLLTEQLNNLAGNLIAGVDLNFDVTSSDDYTTGSRRNRTDLNVGLSKQLLNNRLTVTVGSNFALEGPQQANQNNTNLAGNVALTYQLSRDGRYLLRAYRKNEYFGVVDGYIVETGLRFIITLDYDRFANLFRRKKLTAENRKEEKQDNE